MTALTFQRRKLLRPDPEVTDVVLGVLGKGLQLYPDVGLVSYNYMSSHAHMEMAPASIEHLSGFMCFVQTNISKEVGTRIRDWPGTFWHERFDHKPVLDEVAQIARLRYLLENSVKENLVESIEDWPGANCVHTLLTGEPNVGTWYDRSLEYEASRRKNKDALVIAQRGEKVEVPLTPLPCWEHLCQEERAERVRELLDDIRDEHAAKRAKSKTTVLGVEHVLNVDPFERTGDGRPPRPKGEGRQKPLICHASTKKLRNLYREIFAALIESYVIASAAFRAGEYDVPFPEGTFRPRGAFVDWTAETPARALQWIEGLSPA